MSVVDEGSCSALESKSIAMNEDILESIDNNDHSGREKLKECIKNSHHHNSKNLWKQSHVTDQIKNGASSKKKLQRRFKGSKRMRKIRKKKQRWKRHKQKMC
jgi:hypothetical protein